MEKYYKITGLTVKMDSFGRTVTQAEPYLTESVAEPNIVIQGDWRPLKEQQPHLSEEDCEYLVTGGSFYRQLLNYDGMMLHASAVVRDGKAYLFSAPCGTGKSTHTKIWRQVFPDAVILNDDKPALRREDGGWYAYGTPWSGKTDQNLNMRAELAGVCLLRRGEENVIRPFGGSKAVHDLLEQTARPRDPRLMGNLLELLDKLLLEVPVWEMECNMDPEAARVSYEAMQGERKNK